MLAVTELRDGRLHDARHTAGTVLLLLGVLDRLVDAIMGWEPGGSARMRAGYMHVTDPMPKHVGEQIGQALLGIANPPEGTGTIGRPET
ncbi:integrase [Streptacidiphilus sp. MAP12-16]|uniref:integrase n=1 Tax=Streptacidiphilus sp. MAP12-16 TaxID=3156300 RepID=UPI003518D16D